MVGLAAVDLDEDPAGAGSPAVEALAVCATDLLTRELPGGCSYEGSSSLIFEPTCNAMIRWLAMRQEHGDILLYALRVLF